MENKNLANTPCEFIDYLQCHLAVLLWVIVCPIVLVLGITGNCISLAIWSRQRMRSSTTSIYLRALAVVDTLVLLVAPLRELIFYSTNLDIQVLNNFTCRFHTWAAFTVTALSAWLLSALTIDRLILVKFPLWAKVNCSKKSATCLVVFIIVLVVLINSHMLIYLDRTEIYTDDANLTGTIIFDISCLPNSDYYRILWHTVWPIVVFLLYSLGPTACLITCSLLLIKSLKKRNSLRSNILKSLNKKEEKRNLDSESNDNIKERKVRLQSTSKRQETNFQQNGLERKSQNLAANSNDKIKSQDIITHMKIHEKGLARQNESQTIEDKQHYNIQSKKQDLTKIRDLKPLTKILIAVCLFFLICTTPVCVFLVIEPFCFDVNTPLGLAYRRLAWAVVALVLYCNNASNFVIYCISSKMFRSEFFNLFRDVRYSVAKHFRNEVAPQSGQQVSGLSNSRLR